MKNYRDHYFLKAKQENYPARSVYKLKELDKRFGIFRKGMKVLDLGAAPGSWSLGAAEKVAPNGRVLACDIQDTETVFPKNVTFLREDVFERTEVFEQLLMDIGPFDVIMSDMAPRTTGTRFTDQARSLELCQEALAVAELYLANGGALIVKIFMGPDVQELVQAMRPQFERVAFFKPKSSRPESKEIFYVGLRFRGQPKGIVWEDTAPTEDTAGDTTKDTAEATAQETQAEPKAAS